MELQEPENGGRGGERGHGRWGGGQGCGCWPGGWRKGPRVRKVAAGGWEGPGGSLPAAGSSYSKTPWTFDLRSSKMGNPGHLGPFFQQQLDAHTAQTPGCSAVVRVGHSRVHRAPTASGDGGRPGQSDQILTSASFLNPVTLPSPKGTPAAKGPQNTGRIPQTHCHSCPRRSHTRSRMRRFMAEMQRVACLWDCVEADGKNSPSGERARSPRLSGCASGF